MMKRILQALMVITVMLPVTAGAWSMQLVDPASYAIQDAQGVSRNVSGDFQGPGFSSGFTYGPFVAVNHAGFEIASLGRWYIGGASRVGGDISRNTEGQKMAVPLGVGLIRVMGVDFIAAYNVTDNAWTPTIAFSGTALLKAVTGR